MSFPRFVSRLLLPAALAASCAACGMFDNAQPPPPKEKVQRMEKAGSVTGDNGILFGGTKQREGEGGTGGGGIGVNSFLWRASLDSIGFMPLASADPFGGVIISDWYASPDVPTERFKITIYILDQQLRADGIKAAVFRQTRDLSGNWNDAPVDPKTPIDLENAILMRARQLRLDTAAVR
ncbi:MAG: DUF3576 domain-containing protein [Alphaproteobacteria bacterium]|nr:DUF3576 domain-containing protein [Alphaproteobacteria bacterium]